MRLKAGEAAEMAGLSYPAMPRYLAHLVKKGQLQRTEESEDGRSGRPVSYTHLDVYKRQKEGKNPLVIDSKEPSLPLEDYIYNEVRYKSLKACLLYTSRCV